ncbi:unnamed protein product [Brassica oleracea var. botrytis]
MNNYMLTCLDSEQKKSLSFDTIIENFRDSQITNLISK